MSAHMKKHLISKMIVKVEINIQGGETQRFRVPKEKAKGLLLLLNDFRIKSPTEENTFSSSEVFKELDKKFGRTGAALKGARLKENLSQKDLGKRLKVTQGDLSKMENGKRTIGKKMAQKLSKILKVDYRVFL